MSDHADLKDGLTTRQQLMSHQVELEKLYNKNQTIPRIKKEFTDCKEFNFAVFFDDKGIPLEFGYDFLTQMALHKRTTLPTMVGILRHHFDNSQMTADMILRCVMVDLANWQELTKQLVVKFTISKDVQEELDRYQFPLPMVVMPKRIDRNSETGYITTGGSVILKKNHHEDDVCLDHLNRANQMAFTIDMNTAMMIRNRWRNLDKPKEGETKSDFDKRKKAFEKYDRTSREVIAKLQTYGNKFYLTHKYDKRGRVYAQGYHVSYQGAPWNKAVIQLADKEFVA